MKTFHFTSDFHTNVYTLYLILMGIFFFFFFCNMIIVIGPYKKNQKFIFLNAIWIRHILVFSKMLSPHLLLIYTCRTFPGQDALYCISAKNHQPYEAMPQSSIKNCIKFAQSNRQNSSEMLFGLVCQNVFGTDWCMWPSVTGMWFEII